MAQYAYVQNNEILELHDSIPVNWKNISGFIHMTDSEREALGFVAVEQHPAIGYDPSIHDIVSENLIDSNGKVVYKEVIIAKYTDQQLAEMRKQRTLDRVRSTRNAMLSRTDWAVMPDVVGIKGDAWKNAYYIYRQALRDMTNALPENYNEVQWPVLGV